MCADSVIEKKKSLKKHVMVCVVVGFSRNGFNCGFQKPCGPSLDQLWAWSPGQPNCWHGLPQILLWSWSVDIFHSLIFLLLSPCAHISVCCGGLWLGLRSASSQMPPSHTALHLLLSMNCSSPCFEFTGSIYRTCHMLLCYQLGFWQIDYAKMSQKVLVFAVLHRDL